MIQYMYIPSIMVSVTCLRCAVGWSVIIVNNTPGNNKNNKQTKNKIRRVISIKWHYELSRASTMLFGPAGVSVYRSVYIRGDPGEYQILKR